MAPVPASPNAPEDVSHNKRKLPKHAQGAFLFTRFLENRQPFLLEKNVKQIQEHHQKRCRAQKAADGAKSDHAKARSSGIQNAAIQKVGRVDNETKRKLASLRNSVIEESAEMPHDTSVPASTAMSRDTLLVKDKDSKSRRISARQLAKQDQDPDAVLEIKLNNIRKKLNFKDHMSDVSRPKKRARPNTISCNVHLTIWDNTHAGQHLDPLHVQSRVCDIILDDREDTGAGRHLELRLDRPFRIARRDLEVHAEENGKLKSRLAERYFLEFKFIPMKDRSDWPPFKVLGKSDGDQQGKLDNATKVKLQDSLIARQHELIPESRKALSLFFFTEGVTLRTKYAVDIDAQWTSPEHISKESVAKRDETESWMLDDNSRMLGGETKKSLADSRVARKSVLTVEPLAVSRTVQKQNIRWVYDSHKPLPDGAKKNFREFLARDFQCYSCSKGLFETLEELLFHMETMHNLFYHRLEHIDEKEGIASLPIIAIGESAVTQLKNRSYSEVLEEMSIDWYAPKHPFDINLHTLEDDKSWLGLQAQRKLKKTCTDQRKRVGIEDEKTALRLQHGGCLPSQYVPVFRPEGRGRRKYVNHSLITNNPLQAMAYTSISHRPLFADNLDDEMSDSDDEANDIYLVQRWAQDLDLFAREQSWSDAKRRLYKRWGYHVFYTEQTPHARYMSDTLIRFVRQQRQWLLRRGPRWDKCHDRYDLELESIEALEGLMFELKSQKTISDEVCNDVISMLESDDANAILPEAESTGDPHADFAIEERKLVNGFEAIHLPPNAETCTACRSIIDDDTKAVRCSSLACTQPGRWFHAKCAGIELVSRTAEPRKGMQASKPFLKQEFMLRRQNWKCPLCRGAG